MQIIVIPGHICQGVYCICPMSIRLSVRKLTFVLKFCVEVFDILYYLDPILDWVYIWHEYR